VIAVYFIMAALNLAGAVVTVGSIWPVAVLCGVQALLNVVAAVLVIHEGNQVRS
jgi:hypothetical protein